MNNTQKLHRILAALNVAELEGDENHDMEDTAWLVLKYLEDEDDSKFTCENGHPRFPRYNFTELECTFCKIYGFNKENQ